MPLVGHQTDMPEAKPAWRMVLRISFLAPEDGFSLREDDVLGLGSFFVASARPKCFVWVVWSSAHEPVSEHFMRILPLELPELVQVRWLALRLLSTSAVLDQGHALASDFVPVQPLDAPAADALLPHGPRHHAALLEDGRLVGLFLACVAG